MARQRGTSRPKKKTAKRVKARSAGTASRKTARKKTTRKTVRKKTARKTVKKKTARTAARVRTKTARAKKTAAKSIAGTRKTVTKETTGTVKKVVRARKKLSKVARERMEKLKSMLEERRVEVLANIRKAREETVEANRRRFSEVGDLVSASLEKEMAFKYGEYGVNMLREIDTALEKLKEGSYGICETCGRIIGLKRLEIVPSARLCVRCKSKEEEGTKGNR